VDSGVNVYFSQFHCDAWRRLGVEVIAACGLDPASLAARWRSRDRVHDGWRSRGRLLALQRHVVEHFCHGAPLENTAQAYLRNLAIEEAIYRSADTGRRITLSASVS